MLKSTSVTNDLNRLNVFVGVVQAQGFTAAAQRLGMSKGRVSQQVSRLEAELGKSLLVRSTRRLVLTDAGRELYGACSPMLQGLHNALTDAQDEQAELAGTLRIATSVDHASQFLAPAAAEFARAHRHLVIEVRAHDRVVDLIAEGLDLAIRGGKLPDSSLKAVRLGSFRPCLAASPSYLLDRGSPQAPEDLIAHDWVAMMQLAAPSSVRLSRKGVNRAIRLRERLRVDTNASMRGVLEAGGGIGLLDPFSAAPGFLSGRLVRVLPQWLMASQGVHAVYPAGRAVPAATRAFIDFYADFLKKFWLPVQP